MKGGYGFLEIILTDNRKKWQTNSLKVLLFYIKCNYLYFILELYVTFEIKNIQGRSYHPQTREQVERKNWTLKQVIYTYQEWVEVKKTNSIEKYFFI